MNINFYVIRKKSDSISEKLSDECIKSAEKFGIYNIKKFDGLYKEDAINFIKSKNLTPFLENNQETIFTNSFSRKGAFASHYSLWEESYITNNPICILEHDAIFVKKIPDDVLEKFNDILNFDFISRQFKKGKLRGKFFRNNPSLYEELATQDKNLEIKKFNGYSNENLIFNTYGIGQSYIRGVHGYLIKPAGAKKLIDAAANCGYLTADAHINTFFLDIFYTDPNIVMINQFFCNNENYEKFSHCHNDQF